MNLQEKEMLELFEKNISSLEALRPYTFETLKEEIEIFRRSPAGTSSEAYQFCHDSKGNLNLIYVRRDPACKILIHGEDPQKEIHDVFTKADLSYPQLVLFFGQGLGYIPLHFLRYRPKGNSAMALIEADPQLFLRSLCVSDWTEAFNQERFFFIISRNLNKVKNDLASVLSAHTTSSRHLKILATPSAINAHPQFYHSVAEMSLQIRDLTTLLVGNSIEDSFIGYQNTLANIPMALRNPGIAPLKEKFQGRTAISVAAGPSAGEHWDTLREVQGKIPIIACDVLLRIMLEKGIVPDIVCAIERVDLVAEYFRGVKIPDRTMLLGPLVLTKGTFEAFQGTKIAYCPMVQNAKGVGLDFLGLFHPGSSAGNVNLAIAGYMGFKNVIMVGHNLAFGLESKTSHVKGTGFAEQETPLSDEEILEKSGGALVTTQDGTAQVPTTRFWEMFRHQIENLITGTPETRWINTAAKGAKIEGAELLSLKEALAQIEPESFDFFPARKSLLQDLQADEIKSRRELVLKRLTEAKERVNHWFEEMNKVQKKLAEWKNKIDAKEKSGKRLSLEYLDSAIDEVLRVKVGAVNEDPVFNNAVISIISPAHTTFERLVNTMPGSYKDNYLLKRDFLLEHQRYFSIWEKWVPRILTELEASINEIQSESN